MSEINDQTNNVTENECTNHKVYKNGKKKAPKCSSTKLTEKGERYIDEIHRINSL